MRKFLFHILLLVSMASYAQTVNVMRYCLLGSTPNRSYLVSCVDSILHDMENQLHVLYVSDTAYPIPLADIDSVTFSKEPVQCIHVPGYAGNASAWLFTDGAAMSLSPDTALAGYRHLLIDSLDLSRGTWTSTGRVSICLDSQYRPVVAIDGEHKMRFSYDTDGTFSVSVLHTDSTTEDVTSLSAMRGRKRVRHRTAATSMDSLCHALDVYCAAKEYVGSQPSVLVRGIASSLSESLGKEFPDDFGSLVVSGEPLASSVVDFLTGRFRSASSGSAGWTEAMASSDNATAEYCRWVVEQELDDCTVTVVSADVEGRNDIVLKYMFSGDRFFDSGKPLPAYAIIYSRVDESFAQYTTGTREIHEGFESRVFEDCSGAVYTFRIVMWPSSCAGHGDLFVRTSNSKAAVVAPLYLSQLEQESASTSDSLLTVRMRVAVEYQTDQDRVQLSRWDYGVYVKRGDADSVLYSAKNTGNSGYIDLEFCRSELNMDYTAFRATPMEPIYFGVYTTEAGDITKLYDRLQAEIVYSEAPEAITGEVVDVSSTEATVKCEYKNCQFWNAQCGLEYFTDSKSEPILLDANKEDGEYDFHLDNLSTNTTYNYRAYYEVNGVREYGEIKSFKTKGYFFEENFVDDLDAIYCDDGYIALFGFEEVEVAPDCFSEERVVYIGKVENEEFMKDDAMVMVVDSTNFPVRMATKDVNAIFSRVDEEHFNCAIYTAQSGEWTELENLSYESLFIEKSPSVTRALATGGHADFGWSDVLNGMDILHSLTDGIGSVLKNDQLGVLESNLDIFGNLQPNDEIGLGIDVSLALGDGTNLKGNIMIAVGSYLVEKYEKFVEEHLGKVRISIEDFKRIDATTCEVFYKIEGLNSNGLKYGVSNMILNKGNTPVDYQEVSVTNHSGSKVFANLSTGKYTVEFYIHSSKYYFILYDVKYTFSMFELGLDHYTVAPEPEYSGGKVKFDVEVFLSGDSEELNKWISNGVEFGYYVHYANAFDYKKVTNFSAIFSTTPLTYNLDIEREGFFEENIDYTSFKARAVDYHIGAYAVVDGKILTYDEQEMELVYDEHPEVHTGEASSVSETEATVKCEFEDCLFWNALRGVEYFTDSKSGLILLDANKEDGEYDFHLDNLSTNTTYNYRAYYEVDGVREYGETKSFETKGGALCDDANHVHAVDLGLSVKWACCNVGASVPEGYGGYYAWGETEEKSDYDRDTYQYYIDTDGDGYKEWQNIGSNISGTSYDVAHVKWGGGWRMPTRDEIEELCEKCSWEWTSVNGIYGKKVTGPNGNSIFLPAAGFRNGTEVYLRGSYGNYWSGTLNEDSSYDAYDLYFYSGYGYWSNYYRGGGHTVRPVTDK